jgi:hypothetical protein
VLIAGGDPAGRNLLFEPGTGQVSFVGRLSAPRWDLRATLLDDGRVLLTGGTSDNGKSLASAEIYDPATQRCTRLESLMSVAREDHTATLLADGSVLLTGGEDNEAGPGRRDVVHRAADLFDPRTNTFATLRSPDESGRSTSSRLGDLTSERDDHRATLLNDGTVFIFGGQTTAETALDTGELFVP